MQGQIDFFKIVEALGDGVICVNEDNRIQYINKRAIEIIGVRSLPCTGGKISTCFNICTPLAGSIILDIIEEVRSTGHTRGLEKDAFICNLADEKIFVAASLSKIEMGGMKLIVINFREINKIKKLELEIFEQKKNLQAIYEGLPLGIIVVDKNLRVKQVNPFMIEKFKLEDVELKNKLFGDVIKCSKAKSDFCGQGSECSECNIKKSIVELSEQEKEYSTIQTKILHYNKGEIFERDYQIGIVMLHSKKEEECMILIQDITEQVASETKIRLAKEESEKANQAKSEFLSNMSHEIRTPLNGIIGMIDLAKRNVEDPEILDYLKTAKTSSLDLLQIINSVLDISKIEAGKFILHYNKFNLRKILLEVYNENKMKIKNSRIIYKIDNYQSDIEEFVSDSLRIKQILNNLVDNALKFTEEGSVHIIYDVIKKSEKYELRIKIKDTGIGMEKSYQENLYESFSQEDGSFTRQKGGTGLGLAISKKIIEKLEGEIQCESVMGKGTIFSLVIPLEETEKLEEIKSREEKEKINTKKNIKVLKFGKILLVEDDLVSQKMVKKKLEMDGHQVDLAINGEEAIRCFQINPGYDLIFMDIQMPKMSGIEAMEKIRSLDMGREVPIIALTSFALKDEKQEIMKHEFDLYISKPVQLEKLTKVVNAILQEGGKSIKIKKEKTTDFKTIVEMKNKIEVIKESISSNDLSALKIGAEELYQLIDENHLEVARLSGLRLQMDLRKNKYQRIDSLLKKITYEIDHVKINNDKMEAENVENFNS